MKKRTKKIRKINFQKIFCFCSFIFILVCILWYGGRFIKFYQESHKTITEESATFARTLKVNNNNNSSFKQIKKDYYFTESATNNYVSYSNLLWRVIKINEDNSILLITENIVGTLAYGNNENPYEESNLINWLNTDTYFSKILNEKEKYLKNTSTCIDNIDDIENITCNDVFDNYYLGLLSIEDYLYTGGDKSYINTNKYHYLANKNNDNNIWYITEEGKLDTTDGEDIMGIKATITLSENLEIKKGTGTIEDPYVFEDKTSLIGSYVKLAEDTFKIYEEKDGIIKLILQDKIKENSEYLKYHYSNNTYYHNDTIYGSLAYYLNKTYYNSLSYKDIILENTYTNGFYGSYNNYNYKDIFNNTIETKVSLPSIDDIILNDNTDEYFTNTGISENSSLIYIRKDNGLVTNKNVTSENYIIPCISIKKDNLKLGTGSITDPYRMG